MNASASGNLGGVVVNFTDDVVAYPVLGTLKLVLPLEKLELFGLLGGGVYFISDEAKASAAGIAPVTVSGSDSTFGFHLGGGASYRVTQNAMFGAELKYIVGSTKMYDTTFHFNSLIFAGTLTYAM
jgi:opacity protein-like surface antigen